MSMIKCPECKKEISDQSKECIHCGCPISVSKIDELQKVELAGLNLKISTQKKKGIIVFGILIIFLFALIRFAYNNNQKMKLQKKLTDYQYYLEEVSDKMLEGATKSETCGNLIKNVWYNSIWEEDDVETNKYTKKNGVFNDDFNDSLAALFDDEDFLNDVEEIKSNKKEVINLMKKLKNPPDEYKEAYDELKKFYDSYLSFVGLCIDPSGNYTSYSSKFNDLDSATADGYNKIESYFDS